jgi:hypothetical protein
MSFEGGEESGVFDVVVLYRDGGELRMTAFRDLVVSTREIFDLVLTPERFSMTIEEPDGRSRTEGPAARLGVVHAGFRSFAALREALFLPGRAGEGRAAEVMMEEDKVVVVAPTPGGGAVGRWELEPATLGVERAEVRLEGEEGVISVKYPSYVEIDGTFLPAGFELEDPGARVSILGVVRELELNPALDDEAFLPAAEEGA